MSGTVKLNDGRTVPIVTDPSLLTHEERLALLRVNDYLGPLRLDVPADVPAAATVEQPGKARSDHPYTAKEAARLIRTGTARGRVYAALAASIVGMTDEELQHELDMNPSTERPRRVELVEYGLVVDSGERRTTHAGIEAIVWAVAGREER